MYFDEKEVENLRKVYNAEHPNESPIPKGNIKTVWSNIRKRLHETSIKLKKST